mgnify:CR=1 FL=1
MKNLLLTGSKIAAAAFVLALASGCATKGYVDTQVGEAKRAAENAQATASAASAKADQAAAQAAAAKQAADRSMQCCLETNEKIDRMFQRSMQK